MIFIMRISPPGTRRRLAALFHSRGLRNVMHPVALWALFVLAQCGTHYTPFYEIALENDRVHVMEHALLLLSGIGFWWRIFGQPDFRPLSEPARLAYVLAAMPATAFLGASLYQARHVLYPHYGNALVDQQAGGEIMWIRGGAVLFAAFMIAAALWAHRELSLARRHESA